MLRLKELRKEKGVLQKDVADYLGVDRTTYVRYENGDSSLNPEILVKLSDYFNVSTDYLLGKTDDPRTFGELLTNIPFDFLETSQTDIDVLPHKASEQLILLIFRNLDENDKFALWTEATKLIQADKYKEILCDTD